MFVPIRATLGVALAAASACVTAQQPAPPVLEDQLRFAATVSDAQCNANGAPDPGELVTLDLALKNPDPARTLRQLAVTFEPAGPHLVYGDLAPNQTTSRPATLTLPASVACGAAVSLNATYKSPDLGTWTRRHAVVTGQPVSTFFENFDGGFPPPVPVGWTTTDLRRTGAQWVPRNDSLGPSPPTRLQAQAANGYFVRTELVSPPIPLGPGANTLVFSQRLWDFEYGHGGMLQMALDSGPFVDVATELFAQGEPKRNSYDCNEYLYRRSFGSNYDQGFETTVVNIPAASQVRFRWQVWWCDTWGGHASGWEIDDVQVITASTCEVAACEPPLFGDGFETP